MKSCKISIDQIGDGLVMTDGGVMVNVMEPSYLISLTVEGDDTPHVKVAPAEPLNPDTQDVKGAVVELLKKYSMEELNEK